MSKYFAFHVLLSSNYLSNYLLSGYLDNPNSEQKMRPFYVVTKEVRITDVKVRHCEIFKPSNMDSRVLHHYMSFNKCVNYDYFLYKVLSQSQKHKAVSFSLL